MRYFARFNPTRALRDLRRFLSDRRPHELWFGILAIVVTSVILFGFVLDSRFEKPYKPDILYVESWPLSRTDREIIAQQKIDLAAREKREAEIRAAKLKRQAEFKRLDDQLEAWGI